MYKVTLVELEYISYRKAVQIDVYTAINTICINPYCIIRKHLILYNSGHQPVAREPRAALEELCGGSFELSK